MRKHIVVPLPQTAAMLTEEEKTFLEYWEKNRDKEKKWTRQLMFGLPLGLIFGLPIILNYLSGWYKRANMVGNSQFNPNILIVAVLIIAVFVAIFYKRQRWEQLEQRYHELKNRE